MIAPRTGAALVALALLCATPAVAEPYFAVQQGAKCSTCHMNPTGGGLRNEYGNIWAQMSLAANRLESENGPWSGMVNNYIAVGGDARFNLNSTDVPNRSETLEFALEEVRAYIDIEPVPDRVGIYIDQRVGPGGSFNREGYARLRTADGRWMVKAGQFYLPFGWRLEDDGAFVRTVTGINMNTPDQGLEVGLELPRWSTQLAVTNGSGGGPETGRGKQLSLRSEHVAGVWRIGVSVNHNDTDAGDRGMQGLFAGVRTGPVVWLAEIDRIDDDSFAVGRTMNVALLEANWNLRQGHNLKLTAERADLDDGATERSRFSAVYEYTPWPFVQLRGGLRSYDGVSTVDIENRTVVFAQVHGFF